jgi:uncharacterized protein (DUF2126 family)
VDEARNDAVYELEIAFAELPIARSGRARTARPGWSTASCATCWWTSPATRTAPSSASTSCIRRIRHRRLGLLELRAFEMPPHARMSLAQQLLMRALVARFWQSLCAAKLVRWGTELHDRFMLPHFVERISATCCEELLASAIRCVPSGSRRISSSAFPKIGDFVASREVELRQALEPWHVLGEEGGAGGTVRYVDSSLERLQVKVSGHGAGALCADLQRSCRCRLRPTGKVGEFVGRRALPRLAAGQLPAPDHWRACAAGLRSGRHLDAALAGRLPVSCGASGRAQSTRACR